MGSDYKQAATYPSEEQYERWETHCEELGMRSMSEFVEAMVEAGMKKFDSSGVEPDETNRELRQQRNELKTELDRARDRITDLEDAVYLGERQAIKEFVDENPGASYDDIVQHMIETVPNRVTSHLDDMEGEEFRVEDGHYYPLDEITPGKGES